MADHVQLLPSFIHDRLIMFKITGFLNTMDLSGKEKGKI